MAEEFHGDKAILNALKDPHFKTASKCDFIDLAVNLNPFAPEIESFLKDGIKQRCYRFYPDDTEAVLKLSKLIKVDPQRIILTNGASEAIAVLAKFLKKGLVEKPEFFLYEKFLEDATGGPLWISNPKNPTGELSYKDALVYDESFYPLSTGNWSYGAYKNSYVIGSFTKLLACPGLRLGYLIVPDPTLAPKIKNLIPNWSVSSLALFVLEELLDEINLNAELKKMATRMKDQRKELVSILEEKGIFPRRSNAPYIFIDDGIRLKKHLYKNKILVRDCTSFGYPKAVRIAVGSDLALEAIEKALKDFN